MKKNKYKGFIDNNKEKIPFIDNKDMIFRNIFDVEKYLTKGKVNSKGNPRRLSTKKRKKLYYYIT